MKRDIVVIGGSAGALEPLKDVVAALPHDLDAAVVVVLHIGASSRSALAPILNRLGGMQAVVARDGDPLKPGYVYVPFPDHHLEVRDGRIHLTRLPTVNGVRPAVDVLFRSAAAAHGPRVVGVVLSGGLDDGSAGLAAIRAAGGVAIVQRPDDAIVDSMPRNAIEVAQPDFVLAAAEIGRQIEQLVRDEASQEGSSKTKRGGGKADMEPVGMNDTPGQVTGLTCPDCSGGIWLQTGKGGEVALTCRVGHSYSPDSFLELQAANVENALWAGVRALEEQASLAGVMATRASRMGNPESAVRHEARRNISANNAEALRRLIVERPEA